MNNLPGFTANYSLHSCRSYTGTFKNINKSHIIPQYLSVVTVFIYLNLKLCFGGKCFTVLERGSWKICEIFYVFGGPQWILKRC